MTKPGIKRPAMNRSVLTVVAGCAVLAMAAWLLATALTGGPEDYVERYAGQSVPDDSASAAGAMSSSPRPSASASSASPSSSESGQAAAPASAPATAAPPRSAIPDNEFGELVRQGERIFADPGQFASDWVGNDLSCQNCHFDAGRYDKTASLRSAWPMYPAYRSKNQHVNDFAERLQGCFTYSMNGKAPPRDGEVIQALQAYSFWLAKGMPTGEAPDVRGYPDVGDPPEPPSYARGETVFQEHCALCHGDDGQGQKAAGGAPGFPPLWGPRSYNWGAGMHRVNTAAAFIKAAMPLGKPDLTDQQAWDVALFINSHERPQDPRFTGSVQDTAERFHKHQGQYGKTVNGQVLGEHSPPSGTVP